jgi:hypothetical protein
MKQSIFVDNIDNTDNKSETTKEDENEEEKEGLFERVFKNLQNDLKDVIQIPLDQENNDKEKVDNEFGFVSLEENQNVNETEYLKKLVENNDDDF